MASLVNVTGGMDLSIGEFQEVGQIVKQFASEDATVSWAGDRSGADEPGAGDGRRDRSRPSGLRCAVRWTSAPGGAAGS